MPDDFSDRLYFVDPGVPLDNLFNRFDGAAEYFDCQTVSSNFLIMSVY